MSPDDSAEAVAANLPTPTERRAGWVFLLVFCVFAAGVVTIGGSAYYSHTRQYRAGVERELVAIAELKVDALAQWRRDRLGDGAILLQNPSISVLVRRYLDNPSNADAQSQLRGWLRNYETHYQYDQVFLLDTQGVTRLSSPPTTEPVAARVSSRATEVLQSGQIALQDFYRDEFSQRIHLAVLVPILDDQNADRPLGVLVLRIDPGIYLYPFLKRWPTSSPTAETLLVRREGDEAVFLNELRFQTNTALTLRAPLGRTAMPAVQAALGWTGVIEGRDYRGEPVLAALHAVADSPWSLVARMDATEVYAPIRERLGQTVAMAAALLFAAGGALGLVWRQQRVHFYREKAATAEALIVSEVRYRRFFEATRDGILILDAESGSVVDVNPFLVELLGYSHGIFLGKKVWELGLFKDLIANHDNFEELRRKEYIRYEDLALQTADGRRIEVEFTSHVYLVRHQKVIQCNIRDISARKQAEVALQESTRELQTKNAELERFLYTTSHDLKSPIVTVRTFLDYLEQDMAAARAERVAKDMQFIRAAADKMARQLDAILEISRIGRVASPSARVTWRTLVDEALATVAGSITERKVRTQVADTDVPLDGDRLRLAEIWQNLLENAVKFMGDQPEPCVEIGVEWRGAERVFYVRDNGIGIDPRFQANIFGLFEKLDPKASGSGIGLAIVKRVVELYKGRIWVESAGTAQGTCFCFTLPGAISKPRAGENA